MFFFKKKKNTFKLNDGSWFVNSNIFITDVQLESWNKMLKTHRYALGRPMGTDSAFGIVYGFEPTKKMDKELPLYVLKCVSIEATNPHMLIRMIQEAVFGETFVRAPIPNVLAHRYDVATSSYEILMENVIRTTFLRTLYKSGSLADYILSFPNHQLHDEDMKKVHDTLVEFYKKTKYFHGDLHLENIMVMYEDHETRGKKLFQVFVIDFGAAMPFLKSDWKRIETSKRLYQFIPIITRAFKKLDEREDFMNSKQNDIVWLKHGQGVVHNLDVKQKRWKPKFWEQLIRFSRKKSSTRTGKL